MAKTLSRTQRQLQDQQTVHAVNAVKMISLLALRNSGYGEKRLKQFSDDFNEIMADVSNEHLSLSDISDTIYDEVGLSQKDLRVV